MSTAPHVPATPPVDGPSLDDLAGEMLRGLEAVDGLPVDGHVAVYESVHDRMRTALTTPPGAAS